MNNFKLNIELVPKGAWNNNLRTTAKHIFESQLLFEERNKVLRWKIKANLEKLGLKGIEIEQRNIPFIVNPYEEIEWELLSFQEKKALLKSCPPTPRPLWITPPKVISILVDNYQGIIEVVCNDTNKIKWFLDEVKIKTKYNVIGKFITKFKVENFDG